MTADAYDDPWQVTPDGYAACRSDAERLRFLLHYAVLAPSGHNTQPWRFRFSGKGALELRADRSRALPVVDPADRALVISCAAALANLRAAAAALGLGLAVELLPDGADPNLLARVGATGPQAPAPDGNALLGAMVARRSTRFAYAPEPVPAAARAAAIGAAARAGDATLHWVDEPARRHALAELIAEGDHTQMADPAFRRELAGWVRSRQGASRDGMSGAAFGMPDLLSFVGALAIRTFDMGEGQAARDRALAEGSPALAVVTTPGDMPRDWMAAGEAMQRALLALTTAGLTSSFLNQPIEVPALRPRLAAALSTAEVPQILFRVGRALRPVPPAIRRPVHDVMEAD
jgi:nitroreductase